MTIAESLQGVTLYPIPAATLESITTARGITATDTATRDTYKRADYNLAKADVLMWLSYAPNISQGGQNYSFTDEQRLQYRREAQRLFSTWETSGDNSQKATFGYKGTLL